MQLIAKRDFRNPQQRLKISDPIHPDHVHMGARFTIGAKPQSTFKELRAEDQELVSQLAIADCVSDGTDEKVVKLIDAAAEERHQSELRQQEETKRVGLMVASIGKK